MLKFWVVVNFIIAWAWFIFCATQPWVADVLIINLFSVIVGTGCVVVVFAEDL